MIGNNNYYNKNNRNNNNYNLHYNEKLLLHTLRQVNKVYNVIGDTDTKYLEFIREITQYYTDIVDFLKQSDKYRESSEPKGP